MAAAVGSRRCGSRRRCGLGVSRGGCSPRMRALEWSVVIAASMAGHHASMVAAKRCTSGRAARRRPARTGATAEHGMMASRSGLVPDEGEELAQVLLDGVGVQDLQAGVAGVDHRVPQLGERGRGRVVRGRSAAGAARAVACVSTLRIFKLSKPCQRATGESPHRISLLAFLREPGPDLRLAAEFGPDTEPAHLHLWRFRKLSPPASRSDSIEVRSLSSTPRTVMHGDLSRPARRPEGAWRITCALICLRWR